MITQLNIANMALANLHQEPIVSLDDGSDRALAVREYWEMSASAFLSEFDWSFATRVADLTRFPEGTHNPMPYKYAYGMPDGFVKLIDVFGLRPGGRDPFSALERPDYEVRVSGEDLSPTLILCSSWETPTLKYVALDKTFDHYTPAALEALALRLSMFMAVKLNAGDKVNLVGELYSNARMNAINAEARMSDSNKKLISSYAQARLSQAQARSE